MDILVCMAGTGGTGFGTASYLRSRNPNLQVVLVQPHPDSRLIPEHPDAQIIDGVLPAYDVPESALSDYLRPDWSDACINVRTEEAYETAHEVLRAEGLFLGTSAPAALPKLFTGCRRNCGTRLWNVCRRISGKDMNCCAS